MKDKGYELLLSLEKEKTADEMFEELGYKLKYQDTNNICYRNSYESHIYFRKNDKTIDLAGRNNTNKIIKLEQLQAINKKCEELGWL